MWGERDGMSGVALMGVKHLAISKERAMYKTIKRNKHVRANFWRVVCRVRLYAACLYMPLYAAYIPLCLFVCVACLSASLSTTGLRGAYLSASLSTMRHTSLSRCAACLSLPLYAASAACLSASLCGMPLCLSTWHASLPLYTAYLASLSRYRSALRSINLKCAPQTGCDGACDGA